MSNYSTDDPAPSTPIFDETVSTTAVRAAGDSRPGSVHSAGSARADQAKDTVQDAAGQAKDTAKQTADQVKGQAQQVGSTAADAGQRVASTAKDQASNVASDAVGQARELYGQATAQLSEQAGKQQKNAAAALHSFHEDLASMHQQHSGGGLAAELVQTLSERAGRIADWLEHREPADVLDEVKQYAARRPGVFIALAAVTGVVAARAAKALTAEAKNDAGGTSTTPSATTQRSSITDPYGADTAGTGSYDTDASRTGSYSTGSSGATTDRPAFGVAGGDAR